MRRSNRRLFLLRLRDLTLAGAFLGLPSLAAAVPAKALGASDIAVLRLLCRRLLPLRGSGDRPYDAVIAALRVEAGGNPEIARLLGEGCAQMRKRFGRGWRNARAPALADYLQILVATPFFKTLHGATLFTLINHPAVWAATGYEGESFSKGGYLGRGFNDLNWLPEPPASVMGPAP